MVIVSLASSRSGTTAGWSSRVGIVLATVGAAVGLETIWRSSAIVGQHGGEAYLSPHLLAFTAG